MLQGLLARDQRGSAPKASAVDPTGAAVTHDDGPSAATSG